MATIPATRRVRSTLTAVSFWVAVALPVLYLPLLVSGLQTTTLLTVFLGLFGIHVLALVGGQDYRRQSE